MLKLLRSETGENVRDNSVEETESERRTFYTPTKIVRINSTQNNDPCSSRNKSVKRLRFLRYCIFASSSLEKFQFYLKQILFS